jgi:hypothetical protein
MPLRREHNAVLRGGPHDGTGITLTARLDVEMPRPDGKPVTYTATDDFEMFEGRTVLVYRPVDDTADPEPSPA